MSTVTPFSITIQDITSLDATRAVEFVRRLLWSEAARVGIGKNLINVPDCINVGDGGIDALIRDANPSSEEVIPTGTSGFQIKSSDLIPMRCKRELHERSQLNQPLKPEIERLLDNNGTYILVLCADLTTAQVTARENALREQLALMNYKNAKIRVYTANQLVGFSEPHLGLISWIKGETEQYISYGVWAGRSDIQYPKTYVADDFRKKCSSEIQDRLRNLDEQCPILRITGLPGIGKTRFLFETLSPDDIRNRVVYIKADELLRSALLSRLQNDDRLRAVLVIDECDIAQHEEITRALGGRGDRLAVFTASYDMRSVFPPSVSYRATPLSGESIEKILKGESIGLPDDTIRRISKFADGYPRIAHLLAQSLSSSNSENFIGISDTNLMNRLIGGEIDANSDWFRKTKKVLTAISLFEKIGFEGDVQHESEWLAGYFNVDVDDFKQIVDEQRQRGITQGKYFIYVTPFMLRAHLLQEWWRGSGLNKEAFEKFISEMPDKSRRDLLARFFEQVPYISNTERGKQFIKDILGDKGLYADGTLLKSEGGARFFLNLCEADPEAGLICLKRTIGKWSREELLDLKEGRQEIVWALERIVIWKTLFQDGARLLLRLGVAEVETVYSNNASGVFAGLFSTGWGPVAPSEAPPEERFPVLEEALTSTSPDQRNLGLNACKAALETDNHVRFAGAAEQGLRKAPSLWQPKTWGEVFDAYRRAWNFLRENIESFNEEERKRVSGILMESSSGLTRIQNLADMVADTIEELAKKPWIDKKQLLSTISQFLRYHDKEMPESIRNRWTELKDKLIGTDFSSRLRRYAGMDIFEDSYQDDGTPNPRIQSEVQKLATEALKNPTLLEPELRWLVTPEAENGYQFGYELGKGDHAFSFLNKILTALTESEHENVYFLGGYFNALHEKDSERWESELDRLCKDKTLRVHVPELTWRSGLTDRAARRIIELARQHAITPEHLGCFRMGGTLKTLSEEVFTELVTYLLEGGATGVYLALDFFDFYYLYHKKGKGKLPEQLTLRLLLHEAFFEKSQKADRQQMGDYHWKQVGLRFLKEYPQHGLAISNKLLEYFGIKGTIIGGYHTQVQEVLTEVIKMFPKDVWKQITKYVGPPIDQRAFALTHWLREGPLSHFPQEELWAWVEKDKEKRAWYLATIVPKGLSESGEQPSIARALLMRYGEAKDVRDNFSANYFSGMWTGPQTQHVLSTKNRLLELRAKETNENVKLWLDEYLDGLEKDFERAQLQEERRGF
jgi:hypothetical protein